MGRDFSDESKYPDLDKGTRRLLKEAEDLKRIHQAQYKRYILDISSVGYDFFNDIVSMLREDFNDQPPYQRCTAIFQGIVLQIFECIEYDFNIFTTSIRNIPDFSRMGNDGRIIESQSDVIQPIVNGTQSLAMCIYMALKDTGLLKPDAEYAIILDHPNPSYVVVMVCPE